MTTILEIKNLCKRYAGFALQDVNISLESGYIMGFIGPNGAGKTTTIRLIMNLIRRDSGEIQIFGLDNIRDAVQVKDRIGFAYDDCFFYDELTIGETERLIAPFYSRWDHQAFSNYLDRFGLPLGKSKKKVKDLSRGMKMKLGLAVALSHHADLIIMDEPTSGLDPVFRSQLLDLLLEFIQDESKTVFFSTHITTDLDRIADYITFINQGKIVFSQPRDAIREQYALVKGARELLDPKLKEKLIGIRESSFGWEGLTKDTKGVRRLLGEAAVFEAPSLEDIMVYTVKGDHHA